MCYFSLIKDEVSGKQLKIYLTGTCASGKGLGKAVLSEGFPVEQMAFIDL